MIKGFCISCLILITPWAFAQKVGLVLSGGGAKGLAHVGVLKALEEMEVPIDYIVGTSMGGIVAGCYAAGMSPNQIEDLMLSEEFQLWASGKLESKFYYYYHRETPDASFLQLKLGLDSTLSVTLNTSLVNDQSLNFAIAEQLAQPSAIARNNFDQLFVPLRVITADIFTQSQVVLKEGILSDAVRATMSVPLFFPPARMNGKYYFDGGLYNNFPIDVLRKDFQPDVVIGSNVGAKKLEEYPHQNDDMMIDKTIYFLLLNRVDPSGIEDGDVYLEPDVSPYTALDFKDAKALIDSGYNKTISSGLEIASKIPRRISCEAVATKRNAFNNKTVPLLIDTIGFEGFSSSQQKFVKKYFKRSNRPLYFSEIKRGYYQLASSDYFNNLYPSFRYQPASEKFMFHLSRRKPKNFLVNFGGVIASRSISCIALRLNYFLFNRVLTRFQGDFSAGSFYKSAHVSVRTDMIYGGRVFVEPFISFNSWDYIQGRDFISDKHRATVLQRTDRRFGLVAGIPIGNQYRLIAHSSIINNGDRYVNSTDFSSTYTLDELSLQGYRTGCSISTNQLNRKQYPSAGFAGRLMFDWFSIEEQLNPGNTSVWNQVQPAHYGWVKAKLAIEQYFDFGKYSTGYLLEAVVSNQPIFANYYGTLINAPAFYPLQDSRTLILSNFRGFNYLAAGLRHVITLKNKLDLRIEGYAFKSLRSIKQGEQQTAILEKQINEVAISATTGLVFHSTIGPISLSANYYNHKQQPFGVLLHVGYLLYRNNSME